MNSNEAGRFTSLSPEPDAIRHRLSWFATAQGLLFLSFVLLDKSNAVLVALLVSAGVSTCLPAIASAYTHATLRNGVRLLLALSWVTIGVIAYLRHQA